MAHELRLIYTGSNDVYAILRRLSDSAVWDAANSEWASWSDESIDDYDIPLTSQGGDLYSATFPSAIAGSTQYRAIFYRLEGPTPAITDLVLATAEGTDGAAVASVLPSAELSMLRAAAEYEMHDTCKIGSPSGADRGEPTKISYNYGSAVACGFNSGTQSESSGGSEATLTPAIIRLPIGTILSSSSRLQITHRQGEVLSVPEIFAVIGEARRGMTALVTQVRMVVGNATD